MEVWLEVVCKEAKIYYLFTQLTVRTYNFNLYAGTFYPHKNKAFAFPRCLLS